MANQDVRKLFIEAKGVDERRNFKVWYEDGFDFCDVLSETEWKSEKDKVYINGPTGGMIGIIKPDHKALTYDVRVDRWTYTLKTMTIFKHYYFEGMLWKMYGSVKSGKACFYNQNTKKKDVYIYYLEDWKGRGPVYEVRVKELNKLRPAACAVIAILIKESFVGLSMGEGDPKMNGIVKTFRSLMDYGYTYEEIQKLEAEGRNEVVAPEKMNHADWDAYNKRKK